MSAGSRIRRALSDRAARGTRFTQSRLSARTLRYVTGQTSRSYPAFWYTGVPNFGDAISPIIIEALAGVKPILVGHKARGKLLGTGSILHRARPGDFVLGSGLMEPRSFRGDGIHFLAVRGPRTGSLIQGGSPEIFGDPALLLPQVYTPRPGPTRDIGLIPHISDRSTMRIDDPAVLTIDLSARNWRGIVDQIATCQLVISSSLHGIVVAEAYGIPAVWVQPTRNLRGGPFKFRDYYEGTDRDGKLVDWNQGLASVADQAERPPVFDTRRLAAAHSSLGEVLD